MPGGPQAGSSLAQTPRPRTEPGWMLEVGTGMNVASTTAEGPTGTLTTSTPLPKENKKEQGEEGGERYPVAESMGVQKGYSLPGIPKDCQAKGVGVCRQYCPVTH